MNEESVCLRSAYADEAKDRVRVVKTENSVCAKKVVDRICAVKTEDCVCAKKVVDRSCEVKTEGSVCVKAAGSRTCAEPAGANRKGIRMSEQFISDNIRYIGCDDKDIDLFESQYVVPNGVSYNSYLILDDKIAIMDTVDRRRSDEWKNNLTAALDGRKPDYLVISHLEPDHAGTIGQVLELYPEITVVCSVKAAQLLPEYYDPAGHPMITVKEGETLSLGAHTLQFFMAPMVHWPEVMVTYEQKEKVLFSADGFGKFGTLDTEEDWISEARRYYINIVGKYGAQVQKLLAKAATLDIRMICPLHGPVLKDDLGYYIGKYDTWSSYRPEDRGVVVAYASIHGNTAGAAKYLAEKLTQFGEEHVELMDICRCDMATAVENAFRYDRMVLAASSYDAGVFLPMEDFLIHLRHKTYRNRKVALVENGTWAPAAKKTMTGYLKAMKGIEIVEPSLTIQGAVKAADYKVLDEIAKAVHEA